MDRPRGSRPAALVLACVLGLTGCATTSTPGDSRLPAARSWSGVAGGPANDGRAVAAVSTGPRLLWSRPLGSPLTGTASSSTLDTLFQATVSTQGCNLYALAAADGRKKWCLRLPTDGPRITPVVDGRDNTFLPVSGGVAALSEEGEIRWTAPLSGTPTTVALLSGTELLVIDQLGTAHVLNTHNGQVLGAAAALAGPVAPGPIGYGVPWCGIGARGCPVPGPAAVTDDGTRAYVTSWRPGAERPELVAGDITAGSVTERFRVPLSGGRAATPVLSDPEAGAVYLHDDDGALVAVSTSDGSVLRRTPLGYRPDLPPALLPDGTVVTGGRTTTVWRGDDQHPSRSGPAPVVGVAGRGADAGTERWRRDDLEQLTNPVASPDGHVVVAVRGPGDTVDLAVLSGSDGRTLSSTTIPGASGPVSGLSVDAFGRITVSTAVGTVYVYA